MTEGAFPEIRVLVRRYVNDGSDQKVIFLIIRHKRLSALLLVGHILTTGHTLTHHATHTQAPPHSLVVTAHALSHTHTRTHIHARTSA